MYNTTAPMFPEYVDDEYHHVSTIRLPAFAGMQITNGPYGAISEPGPSTGESHACANKSLDIAQFREVVAWVLKHDAELRKLLFPALVAQYQEMRDMASEYLDEEELDDLLPEIDNPEQLASLCGLVALHVGGISSSGEPRFGIELGCNWEQEHGAGVRFCGLKIVQVGDASDAFLFPKEESPTDLSQSSDPLPLRPKPSILPPKGKTLADRLKKLKTQFPTGSFDTINEAMYFGYELSTSLDNWNHRNDQFLNERIHKYAEEDPDLQKAIESNAQTQLLYAFLWGYVLGQFSSEKCTVQEYAIAKTTVRETMNPLD